MLRAFSPLLSVMVNFMCRLDWATVCPTYLIKHYSRCFLRGYFWMRLTFKSVDWADYSPYVGEPHPISQSLTRTKKLTLSEVRKNPSHLTAFELELFSLAFGLNWKHCLFLGLKPAVPHTGSTPSALLCLRLANSSCRSWYLEAPLIMWANFLWYTSLSLSLSHLPPPTYSKVHRLRYIVLYIIGWNYLHNKNYNNYINS